MSGEGRTVTENPTSRPGRNDRCSCGSGKKYKQCCLAKDAAADRAARAEAAEAAEAAAEAAPPLAPDAEPEPKASRRPTPRRKSTDQPWKRGQQHARSFQKRSGPRKRGVS